MKEKVKDGGRWCLDADEPAVSFQITQHTSALLKHFGAGYFFSRGRFESQIFVFCGAFNEVLMFREAAALIQRRCSFLDGLGCEDQPDLLESPWTPPEPRLWAVSTCWTGRTLKKVNLGEKLVFVAEQRC